ncbi:ALK and LTK ligand 2b [Latimeria chalumnae]|uniref:ALK and LTK ligand 2b n=1 Tax=Latimeria chalumnae TaxID=7897 RepID=UPI0003C15292|nr:PREDICTED: protein FAM150B [Latimeria chalumnae]XP_014350854.1 PREDICTED: protein FAM150B [Latimeria chalumnae]|eukprot:XP_006007402.1 PREDICTED: protein FAM150B [Latimeria chalumnae]
MNRVRSLLLLGLVVLMLPAGDCKDRTESTELRDRKNLLNLIMEIVNRLKKYHSDEENHIQYFTKQTDYTFDPKELSDYGVYKEEQRAEIVPRDLRMKDKFIKHLTGPLYFSPKCSKHFHRLYHNTRDCTIPAYYKRCARLLTRLAVSPMCMEG